MGRHLPPGPRQNRGQRSRPRSPSGCRRGPRFCLRPGQRLVRRSTPALTLPTAPSGARVAAMSGCPHRTASRRPARLEPAGDGDPPGEGGPADQPTASNAGTGPAHPTGAQPKRLVTGSLVLCRHRASIPTATCTATMKMAQCKDGSASHARMVEWRGWNGRRSAATRSRRFCQTCSTTGTNARCASDRLRVTSALI
jgi:hypothetical protein